MISAVGWFVAGMITTLILRMLLITIISWRYRHTKRASVVSADGNVTPEAVANRREKVDRIIADTAARVRWQRRINPDWWSPLKEEVPAMLEAIAVIHYPDAPNPILAPGLSNFAMAIEDTARDVRQFLETSTAGRLLDVSAHKAVNVTKKAQKVVEHPYTRRFNKTYNRFLRPIWQTLRVASPVTWASLAGRNLAARTALPTIVHKIGERAIFLYGGGPGIQVPLLAEEPIGRLRLSEQKSSDLRSA